jgi:hypothetical protein
MERTVKRSGTLLGGWTAAALAGCVFSVELGQPPAPPPPRIDGCVPVAPSGGLDFGAQVMGRPSYQPVVVRNCVNARRTLRLEVRGAPAAWAVAAPDTIRADGTAELGAGEALGFSVEFTPSEAGEAVAVLRARLGDGVLQDEVLDLPMAGRGRPPPDVAPTVDCTGAVKQVPTGMVVGPETDPLSPATVLALHGVRSGECFAVAGDVVVLGTTLRDLEVLAGLRAVGGRLSIGHDLGGNAQLQEVDGLANLVLVEGDLVVQDNPRLRTLDGLLRLVRVGGAVRIAGNRALLDVAGLRALSDLGGGLSVENNRRLRHLEGLRGLRAVPGDLRITGNLELADLRGLAGVTSVRGSIGVAFNDRLKSLRGLEGIAYEGSYVGVQGNASLASLEGLDGVARAGEVLVSQNGALGSLRGLHRLERADLVVVADNAALPSTEGLGALAEVTGNLVLRGNRELRTLGLDALGSVGGLLVVHDNPSLSTADARALAARVGAVADVRGNGTP